VVINPMPHTVNLSTGVLAPSGTVARCATTETAVGTADGVEFRAVTCGTAQGLPAPVAGTLYGACQVLTVGRT
jgi:hypothetical protein